MCVQVPCVYLLSAASTVIRNTVYCMNRKKYFHMFYLDLSPAFGDNWLNCFFTGHREYFDCCVTCLAAKAFFFSLATHWLIMSASRSGETYSHTESVEEEVIASYEGRRVGGTFHIWFGNLLIYQKCPAPVHPLHSKKENNCLLLSANKSLPSLTTRY